MSAKAERSRLTMNDRRLNAHLTEDELLRADANAIAVDEIGRPFDVVTVHTATISATDVFDDGVLIVHENSRMPARNGRIEDRDMAVVAAADEGLAGRKIEFLQ